MVSFSGNPVLVLNADFKPMSYFPLSLLSWQDAVKAVFLERVHIVSEYEKEIHSPSFRMRLPSVVALKEYVNLDRRPAFTRFNVFLRDSFSCQYCGVNERSENLTFDHVLPRCQGGGTSWENIVTACQRCNLDKGGRSPAEARMPLMTWPRCPSVHELNANGQGYPPNFLHESWRDFLYWDTELEGEENVSLLQ